MFKVKIKKGFFRPIHLLTVVVIVVFALLSNFVFYSSVFHSNIYFSFLVPLIFGTLSSSIFIYLFSHKDFFHFMGNIEREEKHQESKYLDKFSHYGKVIASIVVSAIGGSIFLALTIRFLFSKSENRYLIAFISTLISTAFMVSLAKGLLRVIIK